MQDGSDEEILDRLDQLEESLARMQSFMVSFGLTVGIHLTISSMVELYHLAESDAPKQELPEEEPLV